MCRLWHDKSSVLYSDRKGKTGNGFEPSGAYVDFVSDLAFLRTVCARARSEVCKGSACSGCAGYVCHLSVSDDKLFPRKPAARILQK